MVLLGEDAYEAGDDDCSCCGDRLYYSQSFKLPDGWVCAECHQDIRSIAEEAEEAR